MSRSPASPTAALDCQQFAAFVPANEGRPRLAISVLDLPTDVIFDNVVLFAHGFLIVPNANMTSGGDLAFLDSRRNIRVEAFMLRATTFLAALFWLAIPFVPAHAQDPSSSQDASQPQAQPSLGDVARQARKDREKNATKAKTVITDDTLPSKSGLSGTGLADLSSPKGSLGDGSMANALAKVEEAEADLKQLDALDRTSLAKVVLLDNDVNFPNRRAWEDKLFAAKQHYVSHERELIVELKKMMAQVESWKSAQGGQKLDPGDPRAQQLKSKVTEIIQDALRTEQNYRAVVMEGWDLAKQAKH